MLQPCVDPSQDGKLLRWEAAILHGSSATAHNLWAERALVCARRALILTQASGNRRSERMPTSQTPGFDSRRLHHLTTRHHSGSLRRSSPPPRRLHGSPPFPPPPAAGRAAGWPRPSLAPLHLRWDPKAHLAYVSLTYRMDGPRARCELRVGCSTAIGVRRCLKGSQEPSPLAAARRWEARSRYQLGKDPEVPLSL